MGAYNAVRVGDLEIAMVLARELGSTDRRPSLTAAQLQAAFGARQLDSGARERIDAALEAAGVHTQPSILDAHPDETVVLGTSNGHVAEASPPTSPTGDSPPTAGPLPAGAILAGTLIPVLLTTLAGWRFGLSFVAFTVVAAGFLFSRSDPAALLRDGRTYLIAIAGLCLLSVLGAVALAGAGSAKKPGPAAHTTPAKPAAKPVILPPRTTPKATTPKPRRRRRTRTPTPPTPATPSTTP